MARTGSTPDDLRDLGWTEVEPPRRRRRALVWIIVLLVVAGLVVVAAFAAEAFARDAVKNTVRGLVIGQLGLAADQQVDVEVEGVVIPQLLGGRLDDLTIASDDVTIGALTGDIEVNVRDVPIAGGSPAAGGVASVRLDVDQVRALMRTVEGFPADALTLEAPDVAISSAIEFFGASFPIGIALTPSAAEGQIVLAPAALRLGEAEITADDLRQRFGTFADPVLRSYSVCVAQYIPAGLTLTDVQVQGAMLVARLDIDGAIITDPGLQSAGVCA